MSGPDFDVEFLLGGGTIVATKLAEDRISKSKSPLIAGARRMAGGRVGMLHGAVAVIYEGLTIDLKRPLQVEDDDGVVWVIPTQSIVAAKVIDPQRKPGSRIGFALKESTRDK